MKAWTERWLGVGAWWPTPPGSRAALPDPTSLLLITRIASIQTRIPKPLGFSADWSYLYRFLLYTKLLRPQGFQFFFFFFPDILFLETRIVDWLDRGCRTLSTECCLDHVYSLPLTAFCKNSNNIFGAATLFLNTCFLTFWKTGWNWGNCLFFMFYFWLSPRLLLSKSPDKLGFVFPSDGLVERSPCVRKLDLFIKWKKHLRHRVHGQVSVPVRRGFWCCF